MIGAETHTETAGIGPSPTCNRCAATVYGIVETEVTKGNVRAKQIVRCQATSILRRPKIKLKDTYSNEKGGS